MSRIAARLVLAALLAATAVAASCSRTPAPPADPQVRSQAFIDSGNASYRRADFSTAAKRYASAASIKPDDPAAYYGLGMALSKLGRDDEARVAYGRARELAQQDRDALPAGHPPLSH